MKYVFTGINNAIGDFPVHRLHLIKLYIDTRVVHKVLSLIGFLGFIPSIF